VGLFGSVFFLPPASAQLAYTRSGFSAAYAAISSAGGATAISFSNLNDGTTSIPLPFAFTYAGKTWTTANFLAVCTNGFAFFSATSVTSPATVDNSALYTTTAPNNTLAPWWDDLAGGQILWQVQGSAGSRSLTVQWTGVWAWREYSSRLLDFQLVLLEAPGEIEFRYGPGGSGARNSWSESASIGIEDQVGGPAHFIDAVTGSSHVSNGMLNADSWPKRNFRFTPGVATPIATGTYGVGSGGTWPSLSEAVAEVNHRGVAGPVTLSLLDATYLPADNPIPILLGPVVGTSTASRLTIQAAAGVATIPIADLSLAGFCGNAETTSLVNAYSYPAFGLVGSDFVTLDGLAVSSAGWPFLPRGFLVANDSATDGASDNILRSLTVTGENTDTVFMGIEQKVSPAPSALSGTNSRNLYSNLTLDGADVGIWLNGSAIYRDSGCEIASSFLWGIASDFYLPENDLGWGIRATEQADIRIHHCDVGGYAASSPDSSADLHVDGIWVEANGAGTISTGATEVHDNLVHDLLVWLAGTIDGIRVSLPASASSSARIYNNRIWRLFAGDFLATSRRSAKGIWLQDGGGGAGATHSVDFNSIRMEDRVQSYEPTSGSSSAIELGTVSGPVMKIRNNVLTNFTSATPAGTRYHYLFGTPAAGSIGPAGSISDRNILYRSTEAVSAVAWTSGTNRIGLADWQVAVGQDAASTATSPSLVSATDLRLRCDSPAIDAGSFFGGQIDWVAADLDGDTRDSSPDIGADETGPLTILGSAGAGGTISPSGSVPVTCGADQLFTFSPASCQRVSDVLVDGVSVGAPSSYTFTGIRWNRTIAVAFAPITYAIVASAGIGGSITPAGTTNVACGGIQGYSITPNIGFSVVDVLVDGSSVGAVTSYTFTDVRAGHTISATFGATVGSVPNSRAAGTPLMLFSNAGNPDLLDLSWGDSCGAAQSDFAVYEGNLAAIYGHAPLLGCTTGAGFSVSGLTPTAGDRYFLVVPLSTTKEGSYGRTSWGVEIPQGSGACRGSQDLAGCE
jgi:hypothetical protein